MTQRTLDVGVPRVDDDHQSESQDGGEKGSEEEVGDGSDCDHSTHLGIEAGAARDQAGNHQGKDHQLEKSHEELPRVVDQGDGLLAGVDRPEGQAQNEAQHHRGECHHQQQIGPQPFLGFGNAALHPGIIS